MTPTIQNFSLLKSFQPTFNSHLRQLVARIDNEVVGNGVINIFPCVEKCSLNMICGNNLHINGHNNVLTTGIYTFDAETTFGFVRKEDDGENEILFSTMSEYRYI